MTEEYLKGKGKRIAPNNHAAIMGVIYSCGNLTSKLVQEEPTACLLSFPFTPSAEAPANPT